MLGTHNVFIQCRGSVLHLSFSFLISFGHVGQDGTSKAQPRFIHKRCAQGGKKDSASGQVNDLTTKTWFQTLKKIALRALYICRRSKCCQRVITQIVRVLKISPPRRNCQRRRVVNYFFVFVDRHLIWNQVFVVKSFTCPEAESFLPPCAQRLCFCSGGLSKPRPVPRSQTLNEDKTLNQLVTAPLQKHAVVARLLTRPFYFYFLYCPNVVGTLVSYQLTLNCQL